MISVHGSRQGHAAPSLSRYGFYAAKPESFHTIHHLSDSDRHTGRRLLARIDPRSPEYDKEKAIQKMGLLSSRKIVALCHDPEFLLFRQFCESEAMEDFWRERLRKDKYPTFPIPSVDGSETVTLFSLWKGGFYYRRYQRYYAAIVQDKQKSGENFLQAGKLLCMASEAGLPHAMSERLQQEIRLMFQYVGMEGEAVPSNATYGDLVARVNSILALAKKLENRFWSAGSFGAAIVLEAAAIRLATHDAQKVELERLYFANQLPDSEADYPLCLRLMAGAMRCYFAANLLMDRPISERLVESIIPQGLMYQGDVESWEDLQQNIYSRLISKFQLSSPGDFAEIQFRAVENRLKDVLDGSPHALRQSAS